MKPNSWILAVFMTVLFVFHAPAEASKITEIETKGGVKVWTSEDKTLPIFSLRLSFEHAGSAYDPKDKPGLAVFVSRMMTEGADELSSRAFHEALEDKAIDIDIGASDDRMSVSLDSLSENAPEAFDLLKKVLHAPRFGKDDVERIRQELLTDLQQMEENPNYVAGRAFSEIAFKGHPYSMPSYGTAESIKAITVDDLKNFYKDHFTKDALIVSLSGDLTQVQVTDFLSQTLDDLPLSSSPVKKADDVDIQEFGTKTISRSVPQTVVIFALPGIKRDDPEFYAAYLMNYTLGGATLTARLGEEIRRKHGLSYYVNTVLDVNEASHILRGGMAVRNEKVNEAIDLLKKNIAAVKDHPITQEELDSAKDYVIGSFPLSLDTNREFAGYMQMMQWFKLGIDYIDKRSDHFRSVTLEQVNKAAERMLNTEKLLIVAVGGESNETRNVEKSGD